MIVFSGTILYTMPRKSKVTAVPVEAPASDSAHGSEEPVNDAQAMSEVISEIKAEPEKKKRQSKKAAAEEPKPEPQPEPQPKPSVASSEKVSCEHCGKSMTNKTLKYSHVYNCKSKPQQEGASKVEQNPRLTEEIIDAVHKRMACAREAKARLREERLKNLTLQAF